MNKRYTTALFLAFLCCAQTSLRAQKPHWSWARREGSVTYTINPTYPRQVVAATPGRVLWGTIQNQRQLSNTMHGDYIIRELDTAGNQTASVAINGKITLLQAKADAAGNWYLLGILSDSIKVGSAAQILQPGNGLGPERFLLRLHAGTLAQDWFTMIGSDNFCTTESFVLDASGIYLSIDSALSSTITHYEPATGARRSLITQGTRSSVMSIERDGFGQTYVLGTCLNAAKMDFNGTRVQVPANLNYPWYLVHYGANGNYDWHHFMSDITCTNRALNHVGGGGVLLCGDLYDTTTMATRYLYKAVGEDNYVVARFDNDGSVLWAGQRPVASSTQGPVSFGGPAKSFVTDSMLITAPESRGPAIWGTGGVTTNNPSYGGTVVAYGIRDGAAIWAKGIDASYSNIQGIAGDGNAIYVAGVASDISSINFDSVSIPTTTIPFKYVPYLAKLDRGKRALSTDESIMLHGLQVSPNPATTTLHIYTSVTGPIRILDVQGRCIWTGARGRSPNLDIDVRSWARGMYILQQPAFGSDGIIKLILQ